MEVIHPPTHNLTTNYLFSLFSEVAEGAGGTLMGGMEDSGQGVLHLDSEVVAEASWVVLDQDMK
jgi:hypothetical protein